MMSPAARGIPPPPLAVLVVHRDHDALGDGSANTGTIFIGDHSSPEAIHIRAWFLHHGYTVTTHYFSSDDDARRHFPTMCTDVGDGIRAEGARLVAAAADIAEAAIQHHHAAEAATLRHPAAEAAHNPHGIVETAVGATAIINIATDNINNNIINIDPTGNINDITIAPAESNTTPILLLLLLARHLPSIVHLHPSQWPPPRPILLLLHGHRHQAHPPACSPTATATASARTVSAAIVS